MRTGEIFKVTIGRKGYWGRFAHRLNHPAHQMFVIPNNIQQGLRLDKLKIGTEITSRVKRDDNVKGYWDLEWIENPDEFE